MHEADSQDTDINKHEPAKAPSGWRSHHQAEIRLSRKSMLDKVQGHVGPGLADSPAPLLRTQPWGLGRAPLWPLTSDVSLTPCPHLPPLPSGVVATRLPPAGSIERAGPGLQAS